MARLQAQLDTAGALQVEQESSKHVEIFGDVMQQEENVRGYTYNDEMRGQAILQLAQIGLQFDESKSQNPFAYYTAAVTNSFVRVINIEKRNQNIRDDILEMNDMNPSFTRQNQGQWEAEQKRETDKINAAK